eukprot:COSAG01_NODE_7218_length_3301_cov_3.263273_1_plen_524_part_10
MTAVESGGLDAQRSELTALDYAIMGPQQALSAWDSENPLATSDGVPPQYQLTGSIAVETNDGTIMEVEKQIAFLSPVLQMDWDSTQPERPVLLHKVSADAMRRIAEYCRFHLAPGHSIKERKNFNKAFMRIETAKLCELASASHYLDLQSLIDLTCRALAKHIQGKNPEEIRETFNLPDDLTEEEKVAPIEFGTEDARVRMLNSLYARKRKELAQAKLLESGEATAGASTGVVREDTRSVDELLSFIEGGDADGGGGGAGALGGGAGAGEGGKSKARKKRERQKKKEAAARAAAEEAARAAREAEEQEEARRQRQRQQQLLQQQQQQQKGGKGSKVNRSKSKGGKSGSKARSAHSRSAGSSSSSSSGSSAASGARQPSAKAGGRSGIFAADQSALAFDGFDLDSGDDDDDDALDPALREQQDREVEEFARRLNSVFSGGGLDSWGSGAGMVAEEVQEGAQGEDAAATAAVPGVAAEPAASSAGGTTLGQLPAEVVAAAAQLAGVRPASAAQGGGGSRGGGGGGG